MLPWHEVSVFTVQVYLNEMFEGGSTRFYMDYRPTRVAPHMVSVSDVAAFTPTGPVTHTIIPLTGSGLIFNHTENVLHDSEPLRAGTKYLLRGDLMYVALWEDSSLLHRPSLPPEQCMWCGMAAEAKGTRNYAGEVWLCQCGADDCGAMCEPAAALGLSGSCSPAVASSSRLGHSGPQPALRAVLISGKRGSGKDFVADRLAAALRARAPGLHVHRTAFSSVNKRVYAAEHGLDLQRLETDRAFKEAHRLALVAHHTEQNQRDPSWCFGALMADAMSACADMLILSDLRTMADIKLFEQCGQLAHAPVMLRIDASPEVRALRGCAPDPAKDALPTETELDDFQGWTACWDNSEQGDAALQQLDDWLEWTVMERLDPGWPPRDAHAA